MLQLVFKHSCESAQGVVLLGLASCDSVPAALGMPDQPGADYESRCPTM
jgi:hypothetical protein